MYREYFGLQLKPFSITPDPRFLYMSPGHKEALAHLRGAVERGKAAEAEWRVRFANAREQVATAEAACWQEVVRTEFHQGLPVQMKVKEFVETEEYRRAKKAIADLQEEFRRTGLPPGWARSGNVGCPDQPAAPRRQARPREARRRGSGR